MTGYIKRGILISRKGSEDTMNKSVYSIVLADDVVEAVDEMAYRMNTSRSNLINQILAERVQLLTPEKRMKEIFSQIEKLMDSRFQISDQPSDAMISIRSPLKYKYKPTIRYSLELSRDFQGKVGRLKVQFRTQSTQLISIINGFFILWNKLENKYLSGMFTSNVPAEIDNGRYTRDFYSPTELIDEEISKAVGEYIQIMDKCIQIYFDKIEEKEQAVSEVQKTYESYLNKGIVVI